MNEKKLVRKKRMLTAVELLAFFAVGVVTAILIEDRVTSLMAILPLAAVIHLIFKVIRLRVLPESSQRASDKLKLTPSKFAGLLVSLAMGIALGGGILGGILYLVNPREDQNPVIFPVLIGIGLVMLILLFTIPGLRDPEFDAAVKDAAKTDERVEQNINKASRVGLTFMTWAMVLLGAIVSIWQPVITVEHLTVGIIGILFSAFILTCVLYSIYEKEDYSPKKQSATFKLVCFALSLLPVAVMGYYLTIRPVTSSQLAFLVVFVLTALVYLFEALNARKR